MIGEPQEWVAAREDFIITMQNVKYALVISEYYPKVLPPVAESAQPISRLTPHFHDIMIENLDATRGVSAGAIVGLPEAPIQSIKLTNVRISAQQGLTVGYAQVTGDNVNVQAANGQPIEKLDGAAISLH